MGVYLRVMAKSRSTPNTGADHKAELNRLKRVQGQLNGIVKMVEDGRYCIDILTQTKAITSAIHSFESSILEKHISHCLRNAIDSDSKKEVDSQIQELTDLFKKRLKS